MSLPIVEASNPRIPRKKGQPAKSKKHSDLYTDEDPKGTIHGLGFKDVATAKKSVSKIRGSSRSHAHKIQAAIAMEQRARVMGKTAEAAIYRSFINSMKKKTKKMNEEKVEEGWSDKYKKSIDCNNPKGFSQKAHCQGKKKKMNEDKQIKKIVKQLRKSVKNHAKQADTLEKKIEEESNPRIPRKKGQPANSKKHSDLYTDENPKGTIHGLGFKNVATALSLIHI